MHYMIIVFNLSALELIGAYEIVETVSPDASIDGPSDGTLLVLLLIA